jgi:hypothetical protein
MLVTPKFNGPGMPRLGLAVFFSFDEKFFSSLRSLIETADDLMTGPTSVAL